MSTLPHNAKTIDLLKWVVANPNQPFDPNMVVSLSTNHTSDWEWQAVLAQMEELRRQNYITKLKQDGGGSTYWRITPKGENYLRALERAEAEMEETAPKAPAQTASSVTSPTERIFVSSLTTADQILQLKTDKAACLLLKCLLSIPENELNRHNFFISDYPTRGFPAEYHEKVKSKLGGAWSWLQGQGYLMPRPGNTGSDWVSITDDGRIWAEQCAQIEVKESTTSVSASATSVFESIENTGQPDVKVTSELSSPQGVEVAIRALSDKPSDIDLLEFGDYAQALADFIKNEKTQKPLTIGIDGAWGSGKTTLMKMIQLRLGQTETNRGNTYTTHTVWFNAWKYDREESLWAALALEILSQVRDQCGWYERIWLWFRLNFKRFDKSEFVSDLLKFIAYPATAIVVTLIGTFFWKGWISKSIDSSKLTATVIAGGLLSTLLAAVKQIHDQIVAPFKLNISKYLRTPDYDQRVGFLGEFERDFKFVIDAVTSNSKSSLVIFVDDLDRCEPAKPVEVIEAINHLLDADPCVFVMGMDVRSIAASIEAKYKDLAESLTNKDASSRLPLGYRFLEKIVQVPFRLPEAGRESLERLINGSLSPQSAQQSDRLSVVVEAEQLIKNEENKGMALDKATQTVGSARPDIASNILLEAQRNVFARTFDDDEEVRLAINEALPFLEANARKIKRFINLFRLQLLIANRRRLLETNVIKIRQLARWIVLMGNWPEIIDALNDPGFCSRLLEANQIWTESLESQGVTRIERNQTFLEPYLEDPRIKKFIDATSLIQLLRSFVPLDEEQKNIPEMLTPYMQLSGKPRI